MDELTREIFLVLCSDDYRYLFIDNSEGGRYDLAISLAKVVSSDKPAAPYPPNTLCCCGDLIHPDMPNVEAEPGGRLFHWNDQGGGHVFDADLKYPT